MSLRIKQFQDAHLDRFRPGLGIAFGVALFEELKRRWNMSPLMLVLLVSLVPFPLLALVVLAERWMKPARDTTS
jgi:hypothetical protein